MLTVSLRPYAWGQTNSRLTDEGGHSLSRSGVFPGVPAAHPRPSPPAWASALGSPRGHTYSHVSEHTGGPLWGPHWRDRLQVKSQPFEPPFVNKVKQCWMLGTFFFLFFLDFVPWPSAHILTAPNSPFFVSLPQHGSFYLPRLPPSQPLTCPLMRSFLQHVWVTTVDQAAGWQWRD